MRIYLPGENDLLSKKPTASGSDAAFGVDWLPLADAAEAFAPSRLQRRYRSRIRRPRPELDKTLIAAPNWLGFQAYISQFFDDQQERSKLYGDIHALLLGALRAGHLEASGIRVPAVNGGEIDSIPAHYFDERPRINWARNTLVNFGVEYHRLRVRVRPAAAAPTQLLSGPTKGPGRPSKDKEINLAIDRALQDGIDLNSIPRKEAIDQVRKSAKSLGLDTRLGFSDSVVQRCLHGRFGSRS